ncbi:hypothetical protein D8S78_11545 [Natrialba swarupiae]|nr:hypothetical protein [Natrialba swarupiae]
MDNCEGMFLDSVYDMLSETRCRYVLYHLNQVEETTVKELARVVTRREQDRPDEDNVTISLIYDHLPRLAGVGVIDYERANGTVETTDRFDPARETIERSKRTELEGNRHRQSSRKTGSHGCSRRHVSTKGVARNTNVQPHPVAACRVGWLTLVPGGDSSRTPALSRARVRRAVIAPEWVCSDGD